MEAFGAKQNFQVSTRRVTTSGHQKDLWFVVQEGSVADVDSALASLKKNGGNINSRNTFGLTALHIATRRNNIPIVRRLLAAGADPDARDGESGWSSLHRALHFGHLAVASILLQSGASATLEDSKLRTPIDLLSGPVLQAVGNGHDTEVFSWGSGANYQLGTGNACIQKLPCKVDCLHDSSIKLISAAKFHSIAITDRGEVFSWGFGRGGRLGHPDFDIHSGQAAVITPRQVTFGLGSRCVKAVAAAKHHTVIATESGEVFTWGSNREGQLGYTSVDTQPTPRRVSSLRSKVVATAAANKHTAVVTDLGEVFTWGCNEEGQLGYGTSNSGSNYIPRVVEYLKGKVYVGVAAAKYHTIVLGADGEVIFYAVARNLLLQEVMNEVSTWGHRLVTPRRVVVARNLKKNGSIALKFHRVEKLHVTTVAAGMVHSLALADDGSLFYWKSSDPDNRCQQLYSLCQRNFVSVSAGKYWAAAVTTTGDVYMWDGKKDKDKLPSPTRLHGMKKATSVSVGETHLLIVGSLYHPAYACKVPDNPPKPVLNGEDPMDELSDDILFGEMESDMASSIARVDESACRGTVPSLKSLCEKAAAECLVEPRNAMQLLEIADSLEADELRKHCEDIVIRNLDYIFVISPQSIASASLDVLAKLEKLLDLKSSEAWSYRRLPTPTATFPAVINSEEEDSDSDLLRTRVVLEESGLNNQKSRLDSSFLTKQDLNEQISKQIRALRKKLQQIEMLEEKQSKGHRLDDQQIAKLQTKSVLESSLTDLGVPMEELHNKPLASESTEGRGKNVGISRKQKRKGKKQPLQAETLSGDCHEEGKSTLECKCLAVKATMERYQDVGFFPLTKEEIAESEEKPFSSVKKESWNDDKAISREVAKGKSTNTLGKKKSKKGGLSMFLSGALDDVPKEAAPPSPLPKSEGPAWGGAKLPKGSTSLREILDEQKMSKDIIPITGSRAKQGEVADVNKSEGKRNLSLLIPSSPLPVQQPPQPSHGLDADRGTPPWASSGTPPLSSRPFLRDIQLQQQGKQQQALLPSPKTRTSGFAIASGQGSPSDTTGMNRWFKPEVEATSSIRAIQVEEKAMKDLRRFYSSVKVIKNHNY